MNWLVTIAGVLIILDAIGSILIPGNHHSFWYDLERIFRGLLGLFLIVYSIFKL
jgi:hypothetical protein